jgi:NADP-dependent 3-hydroxy acid dehydrogenase YdfG
MKVQLKKINEQVLVITGASSGIGLVTARTAARRGARLVLAARNEDALRRLTDEITAAGGEAIHVVADVGREEDVRRVADQAVARFGG